MLRSVAPKLIDPTGRAISIAQKSLAVGGEGAIYEVNGDPSVVAKVYNKLQPKDRSDKLRAMAGLATLDLLKIAAWPTSTLHTSMGGPVAGILMPRVSDCKEIHHLYSVAQRKKDYPDADYRFLAYAAMNSAIAFETIHRHGHVIGDVNQKNVLVSGKATVQFVDCDSFQVRAASGQVYRCVVGVPEYTPPELQGRSFRDVDRDPNHDQFGLAVLIFHLLMMGRHPFSGVYLDPGDMPLEKAIQDGRFAYSRTPQRTRMKPPPNIPPMTILDATLVALFERAFAPIGPAGPPARPTATEWRAALAAFLKQLGQCKSDPKHLYPKQAGSCPWCLLFGSARLIFFIPGFLAAGGKGQPFHLNTIWAEVERIAPPSMAYTRPSPSSSSGIRARPVPPHIPLPKPRPALHSISSGPPQPDTFLVYIALIGAFAGFLVTLVALPIGIVCLFGFGIWYICIALYQERRMRTLRNSYEAEKRRIEKLNNQLYAIWEAENPEWSQEYRTRQSKLINLEALLAKLESDLVEASRNALATYQSILQNLRLNKDDYKLAKLNYSADLQDLTNRSSQIQFERYLDSFLIRDAKLKGMGTDRILSLSSFGIETALDLDKLNTVKVPGIGPVLTQRLTDWKDSLIRSFKPKPGLPDAERAVIEQRHLPRLRQIEGVLTYGPRQLRDVVSQSEARRKVFEAQIRSLLEQLNQQKADLELMDRILTEQSHVGQRHGSST